MFKSNQHLGISTLQHGINPLCYPISFSLQLNIFFTHAVFFKVRDSPVALEVIVAELIAGA